MQMFLVEAQLHEEGQDILAVEGITQHIHSLLELGRTQGGRDVLGVLVLGRHVLKQGGLVGGGQLF